MAWRRGATVIESETGTVYTVEADAPVTTGLIGVDASEVSRAIYLRDAAGNVVTAYPDDFETDDGDDAPRFRVLD